MGTLLSSPCQLGLGVDLSHLGQSLTIISYGLIIIVDEMLAMLNENITMQ